MSFSFTGKLKTLPQIAYLDLKDHFAGGRKEGQKREKRKRRKGMEGMGTPSRNKFLVTALVDAVL